MEMHLYTLLMEDNQMILNKEDQEYCKYLLKYLMKLHFRWEL